MDPELREAFATLSSQVADVGRDSRAATQVGIENGRAIHCMAAEVTNLGERVGRVERHVFGSDPPPPAAPTFVARVSSAEGDVAELAGRMIRLETELGKNTAETQATKELLERNTLATEKIEKAFTGVVASPTVQKVTRVLMLALLGWLATKGYVHP